MTHRGDRKMVFSREEFRAERLRVQFLTRESWDASGVPVELTSTLTRPDVTGGVPRHTNGSLNNFRV